MRNQRGNLIPVPVTKSRPPVQRKSCSSQTERVVLIKEEHMSFYPCSRFGHNDGGMRRDYAKAVNYINSCHKFINTIVEKNNTKADLFLLPMVTNFVPIFPYLVGKKPVRHKEEKKTALETKSKSEERKSKSEERKNKSNFGVKKAPCQEEAPADPAPVGDCEKNVREDNYATQVANIVKEQIQQFLDTLQGDMTKAIKKGKSVAAKQKCKNLDIVKQRLEELSKICFIQKNIGQRGIPQLPSALPSMTETSEECSVIMSDAGYEEKKMAMRSAKFRCYEQCPSSVVSETSDIKSDSDLELINY